MGRRDELMQRYAAIRAQAAAGASSATFRDYESLWHDARDSGEAEVATRCLADLAELTAQIDPAIGRALARAIPDRARPATPPTSIDLSVVVVGAPESAGETAAQRGLARQTLAAPRFETILADASGPAARNEALAAARGRVVLFLDADVEPAGDALERVLAAHADGAEQIVVGRVDFADLAVAPLTRTLVLLGLEAPTSEFSHAGAIAPDCCTAAFLSAPRATLARLGGFDAGLERLDGVDLAVRLGAIRFDPALRATRRAADDLGAWRRRARDLGADWCRLFEKHGASAPPAFLQGIGLERAAAETLVATLLRDADGQARCAQSLEESLRDFTRVVVAQRERADELFAKVADDFARLLLRLTRHELARGFVHAVQGAPREALERCAAPLENGAAVLVAGDASLREAIEVVRANLPPDGRLIVAIPAGAPDLALPSDARIVRLALSRDTAGGALRQALLGASDASFFVLLDGSCAPTRSEWEAIRVTLGTLPCIGACSVEGDSGGPLAQAELAARLPEELVAIRRDVLENDPGGAGTLLERLARRGLRLATAKPGLVACP